MFIDTVVLTGTVVIEGAAFHWSVTRDQRLAVSHEELGTRVEPLAGRPQAQARDIARRILERKVSAPGVDGTADLGGS